MVLVFMFVCLFYYHTSWT